MPWNRREIDQRTEVYNVKKNGLRKTRMKMPVSKNEFVQLGLQKRKLILVILVKGNKSLYSTFLEPWGPWETNRASSKSLNKCAITQKQVALLKMNLNFILPTQKAPGSGETQKYPGGKAIKSPIFDSCSTQHSLRITLNWHNGALVLQPTFQIVVPVSDLGDGA